MFLLFGCVPYVSIVWRSTICFYCVALDHMFLLFARRPYVSIVCDHMFLTICFYCVRPYVSDHMFLLCGARPYVSIVWVEKHMFLFIASKPYVFIGLPHPSPSQGRNLLALHK